jgi:16S rRNA C967 or C1407 C5-methylase (RsmB/RsmF family)
VINEFKLSDIEKAQLCKFSEKLSKFSWKKAFVGKSDIEKFSIEEAIPTFFINHLLPVMDFDFLKNNVKQMNDFSEEMDSTIRVNTLSSQSFNNNLFNTIFDDFKNKGVKLQKDDLFLELYHVSNDKKHILIKSEWYKSGALIFQDKASSAIVYALSPQPNDFVCDMCSAPGIKSSLIAQYTNNQCKVIALEFYTGRIYEGKRLLNQLSVLNTYLINADSIKIPMRFEIKFDKILLDAPCTGSGTFQANPELKWRQNEKFLHQNVVLQKKLLESVITILKPNGILVYSTCSLYPEEGEYQIFNFLDKLEPLSLPNWFSPSYTINNSMLPVPGTGRLFPSIHHTQGFFVGKFKKKDV